MPSSFDDSLMISAYLGDCGRQGLCCLFVANSTLKFTKIDLSLVTHGSNLAFLLISTKQA